MVKLCVLGSGSKGNSTYLKINGYEMLLDAGFSYKEIKKRLACIDKNIEDIKTIFISHEHRDHVQALPMFRKNNIRIYSEAGGNVVPEREIHIRNTGIKIMPFRLSHDEKCVGYRIEHQDFSLLYIVDTGCIPEEAMAHCFGATAILFEFNYDLVKLTENQKYPTELMERVAGEEGHMDNIESKRILKELDHDKLELVMCMHLSQQNNNTQLVRYEAGLAVKNTKIAVGVQNILSKMFFFV